MKTPRWLLVLFALSATQVDAASIELSGPWKPQQGGGAHFPPIEDLNAFRAYFADVLRGYDYYAPFADELAAGIEAVSPFMLKPRTIDEMENGFGGDLDAGGIGFNPLATGGTQDIATGGDFIDKQLGAPAHTIEAFPTASGGPVFKQEFGQVQGKRLASPPPGGDPGLEWYSFEFLGLEAGQPFPGRNFSSQNLTTRLGVVPEPSAALLAAMGAILLVRPSRIPANL
ncbi:hypothetical protein MalM25_18340 [Planctomycetes bacterium MalM25]|nr:hypothetical protein MalM25_18340 [Planctomycetes bacterium MalM25]